MIWRSQLGRGRSDDVNDSDGLTLTHNCSNSHVLTSAFICYCIQVHGNTSHISALFYGCFPNHSWMCIGYYQSLLTIFQLRFDIPPWSNMATDNNIPLLWNVLGRLFISYVLFSSILPFSRGGGLSWENCSFRDDDHVWSNLHDSRGALR